VRVNGASVSFSVVNETSILFTAPGLQAGAYDVQVTNDFGSSQTISALAYIPAPVISTASPGIIAADGGTIVTILGANFLNLASVEIGGASASFQVVSDQILRVVSPQTTSGLAHLRIQGVGGIALLQNAFEVTQSALIPTIMSITPATGPIAGGTTVTLFGTNFSTLHNSPTTVIVGGNVATNFNVIDDSNASFVTPSAGQAGAAALVLSFSGQLISLTQTFEYSLPPGPVAPPSQMQNQKPTWQFTGLSKEVLRPGGGEVQIFGRNFGIVSSIELGGHQVEITHLSPNSILFRVGSIPVGVWDLVLRGEHGKLTIISALHVIPEPDSRSSASRLGHLWIPVFSESQSTLESHQRFTLMAQHKLARAAKSIVCWAHASGDSDFERDSALKRAEAACRLAKRLNPDAKTIVREHNVPKLKNRKSVSVQFWG
jgi:hypothetical protein